MITEINRDELIRIGSGLRGAQLGTQAGYTLGISDQAGEPFAALLSVGYLEEVRAAKATVDLASGDKTNMDEESKTATVGQNAALRAAKVWRRKVVARGQRMRRQGRVVPDVLTTVTRASTVAPVLKQVVDLTSSLRENLPAMGEGAQALLDEGLRLHDGLSTADSDQEVKRLSTLPDVLLLEIVAHRDDFLEV